MSGKPTVSVRLPPAESAWLGLRKKENCSSLNSELINAVRTAMKAEPLEIFITEVIDPKGISFCASLGKYSEPFHESDNYEEAYEAARLKAKSLELSLAAIKFHTEVFGADRTHG